MTISVIIEAWMPWSTGDSARWKSKAEAVQDLRRQLNEAGFVIVPREPTDVMLDAVPVAYRIADPPDPNDLTADYQLMIAAWKRSEGA